MSMFDYVRCECRLPLSPDAELRSVAYQSKDIKLWERSSEYRPQVIILTQANNLICVSEVYDFLYSGEMYFYTSTFKNSWVGFKVEIVDNKIIDIKPVEFPSTKYQRVRRKYG